MITPDDKIRQGLYNDYVLWRLELLHCDPSLTPADVSDFNEWCKAQGIKTSTKKPKFKKRKRNAKQTK